MKSIKNLIMSKQNWPIVLNNRKVVLAPFVGFNHWINSIYDKLGSTDEIFNIRRVLTQLQYGEKDLLLHDVNVFHYQLSKLPFQYGVNEVGRVVSTRRESSIFALTNENLTRGKEDSISVKFSRGIFHLRKTGKLRNILAKYRIKDWYDISKYDKNTHLSH